MPRLALDLTPLRRSRDLRLLMLGDFVTAIGTQAALVALPFQVYSLTHSAFLTGLLGAIELLPLMAMALWGGALADRYDRRTLMLVSDAARFVVIAALAVLDAGGHLTIHSLAAIALVEGLATGFFTPALGGLIPLVVEDARLGSANALIGIARQSSFLIGPSVASLLYGLAGATVVFGFNACTYLVSFAFVFATRPRQQERASDDGTLRAIREGFRYIAGVPWLWITIALFAFVLMLQWASIQVLTPKLVREHFDLGVGAYGLIFSLIGGGMIIGTFLFGQLGLHRRRGLISYLIWIANSALVILFALSPWYPLAASAAFLRGICIGFGVTIWETMLMELVPRHMLSRVVSLDWFGSLGLTPFGLLLMGGISDLAAPGTIIALAAAISICIIALGLTSKQIRTID